MQEDFDDTPRTWKLRYRKEVLNCSFCPPNKGENSKRRSKHFYKSWKVKGREHQYK